MCWGTDNNTYIISLLTPRLIVTRALYYSYPSSHLVLCEVGSTGTISFLQMGKCRTREGQDVPRVAQLVRCGAGVEGRSTCSTLSLSLASLLYNSQQPSLPTASPCSIFPYVSSLNQFPLPSPSSPSHPLAPRSPCPPSEIVSISPITFAPLLPPWPRNVHFEAVFSFTTFSEG